MNNRTESFTHTFAYTVLCTCIISGAWKIGEAIGNKVFRHRVAKDVESTMNQDCGPVIVNIDDEEA